MLVDARLVGSSNAGRWMSVGPFPVTGFPRGFAWQSADAESEKTSLIDIGVDDLLIVEPEITSHLYRRCSWVLALPFEFVVS